MRTILPGAPGLETVKDLSSTLGRCTRGGTELDALSDLNAAAGALWGTGTVRARRMAAGALVWAMIRHLDRRANIVLLYGQISRHLQLEAVSEWLTAWVIELVEAPLDPAADSMRTAELQLHLALSGVPEAARLNVAAAALARFGNQG